jgi:hypothetical protein
MKPLSLSLKDRPLSKASSERALILSNFIAYLELENGRPFTEKEKSWQSIRLNKWAGVGKIGNGRLRDLYSTCVRYCKEGRGAFGKAMNGILKTK